MKYIENELYRNLTSAVFYNVTFWTWSNEVCFHCVVCLFNAVLSKLFDAPLGKGAIRWLGEWEIFCESYTVKLNSLQLMSETDCFFRALLLKTRPLQLQDRSVQLKDFFCHFISCTVWSPTSQTLGAHCWHMAALSLTFRVALSCPPRLNNWHSLPLHI
jgi:hypothetical protein